MVVAAGIAAVIVAPVAVARADEHAALRREVRSALAAMPDANTTAAVSVVDLAAGSETLAVNADTPLVPASSMKILTIAAAIATLGTDFEFTTRLATDGGDVYLIGDGDPALGDEKLCSQRGESITGVFERWSAVLQDGGVRRVAGDIVVDDSIFGDALTHPTWEESDLDNWYAAPAGGLNFNDNCVDITVTPASTHDRPVLVSVVPKSPLVRIINNCVSGGKGQPVLHHVHDTTEYTIRGRCNKKWRFGPVSFPDPALLAGSALRAVLTEKGIPVAGTVRRGRVRRANGELPAGLTVVAEQRTPLADVLRRAGKDSQNLFAECLMKRAGYAWSSRQLASDPKGGWEQGREAILATLRRAGINTDGLSVADGSGLSRANACTARHLTQVLAWMSGRPGAGMFYESLSVAGVDGSLHRRLKDAEGRVRVKTGTMRGVRALAGYVEHDGRPRYAFAIMFNGYTGSSTPYKEIQDRICRAMLSADSPTAGSR